MNAYWAQLLPRFIRRRIEGRVTLQRVIGNTAWLAADRILRLGVSLVVTAWVARYLGPEQYGLFNYAAALVALLGAIGAMGLEGILVREFVRDPDGAPTLLGTALALRVAGGVSVFLISYLLVFGIRPGDHELSILVAIIALGSILQAFDVFDQWFQSQLLSRRTVVAKNAAFLLIAAVKVALILSQASLPAFAWAASAEIAVGAVAMMMAYRGTGKRVGALRFRLGTASNLLKESWPLIISGMAIGIYMRIDQVMLGQMLQDKAVGIYTAATRLTEVTYIIPTMIVASASPALFSLRNTDEALYLRRLEQLFRVLVVLALAMAIPVSLFSGFIVHLLYGSSYSESRTVLTITIWAAVFVFLGAAQHPWNLAEGLVRLTAWRTAAGAVMNVILNFFFIPKYEAAGAAAATVISQAFVAVLLNVADRRTRGIFFMQLRALAIIRNPLADSPLSRLVKRRLR